MAVVHYILMVVGFSFATKCCCWSVSDTVCVEMSPVEHEGNCTIRRLSLSKESTELFSITTEADLNQFILDSVQPTEEYFDRSEEVVESLTKFIHNNVPDILRPRKIIKCGSFGKGTVVNGKSDIDLTILLARYTQVRDLVRDMDKLLTILAHYLRRCHGVTVVDIELFYVQIEVRCQKGHTHRADILLAVDVLEIESSRDRVYEKMSGADRDIKEYYSASFVSLMVDMFARLPTKLKSLVRLVKYWKGQVMTDKGVRWPKSYGFELVTVIAWMRAGEPSTFNMTRALHAVLTCLINHRDFRAEFGARAYYNSRFLRPPKSGPYIMDPLDPYDNVYSRKSWDWDQSAVKAREWLQTPLFHGVVGSTASKW